MENTNATNETIGSPHVTRTPIKTGFPIWITKDGFFYLWVNISLVEFVRISESEKKRLFRKISKNFSSIFWWFPRNRSVTTKKKTLAWFDDCDCCTFVVAFRVKCLFL
jgi:hypothetical protein